MEREERERPDQQPRHKPERPEYPGIFLRIVMRGMRQVSGELTGRALMAFLARADDVLTAQGRTGVIDGKYLVRTVAVRAFRGFPEPQLDRLPVESLEISFGDIQMAFPANIHDLEFEITLVRPLDGMRRMAIIALRQFIMVARLARGMDAQAVFLINTVVALGARAGDISRVDAGSGIARRKLSVGRVAAGARGRDHQPALEQSLAMDAFFVMLDHVMLCSLITDRGLAFFLMAARAQDRHIRGIRGRHRILFQLDRVGPVAIRAHRRVRVTLAGQLPVDTTLVLFSLLVMAAGAIDLAGDGFARADL